MPLSLNDYKIYFQIILSSFRSLFRFILLFLIIPWSRPTVKVTQNTGLPCAHGACMARQRS